MKALVVAVAIALLSLPALASHTANCYPLGAELLPPWEEAAAQATPIEFPSLMDMLSLGADMNSFAPCSACMKWCTQTLGQSAQWCLANECYWECI
jgi:hypothetical protein